MQRNEGSCVNMVDSSERDITGVVADMAGYKFRLRFCFVQRDNLGCEGSSLLLHTTAGELELRSWGRKAPIKESQWLVLTGGPFPSQELARKAAEKAKSALLVYALQARTGIDLGRFPRGGFVSSACRAKLSAITGGQILNEHPGTTVYEDIVPTTFVGGSADFGIIHSVEAFRQCFADSYVDLKALSPKQRLALELYSASHFDISPRARFVTLMIAVEALLVVNVRSTEVQDMISSLIQKVRESDLKRDENDSIVSVLRHLKNESIGNAGRSLARRLLRDKKYEGMEAGKFFGRVYGLRSELVHTGAITFDPGYDLLRLAGATEPFVADLLTASLAEGTDTPTEQRDAPPAS